MLALDANILLRGVLSRRTRDIEDWPTAALALTLGCPIWTEDADFFGTGIATWTTDRVKIFLCSLVRPS